MLLALSGVTGIGKSYFKERLVEELNFHKVNTIRTRPIRIGEKNGVDGIFITDSELDELKKQNKIDIGIVNQKSHSAKLPGKVYPSCF